ncbi:hypothetical protein RHMOL_Rhmol07G0001700 [Rhododendron molle]|uniref:Uncharacterized protein n=1 Tax=Rhododendron molle TaxID=49168 RepID=A0ACC0MVX4_RHOML|nr:hypothetical protein RHMOL_Rhmol07G0001700 [Rhododendron molle]
MLELYCRKQRHEIPAIEYQSAQWARTWKILILYAIHCHTRSYVQLMLVSRPATYISTGKFLTRRGKFDFVVTAMVNNQILEQRTKDNHGNRARARSHGGISNVNRNLFTYANLIDVIEEMGCPRDSIIYHKLPNADLDGGLVGLTGDIDLLDMFATHEGFHVPIEVYVDSLGVYNGSEDDKKEFNVPRESDLNTEHEGDKGDSESDTSGLVMSSEENEEYDVPIEEEVHKVQKRLWDYCEMVRRHNPGSTAVIKNRRTRIVGYDFLEILRKAVLRLVESEKPTKGMLYYACEQLRCRPKSVDLLLSNLQSFDFVPSNPRVCPKSRSPFSVALNVTVVWFDLSIRSAVLYLSQG